MPLSILDRLETAAIGAGVAKLSGKTRYVADQVANLFNNQKIGKYKAPKYMGTGVRDPLEAASARGDPLLGVDWFCDLPTLYGTPSGTVAKSLSWEMVEEANLPMYDFEPMSNYRAGKMYHYPSHQNLGSLTLKLYEDIAGYSTAYIKAWQSLIFDKASGLYNPPSLFKLNIKFTLYDVGKKETMVITYLGCWPQTVDAYSLVGGSSDRIVPGVTFSVDDVEITFSQLSTNQVTPRADVSVDPNAALPNFGADMFTPGV